MKLKHIIVVEDDPFWLDEIASIVEGDHVRVHRAEAVDDALALYRRYPNAVVVSDIILPKRDGLELLKELKAINPDVRFVAVTSGGRLGAAFYLRLASAFGAEAGFSKPLKSKDLRDAVSS